MEYTEENRGKVQAPKRAHQFISFEGMKYGTISPTDVDALIEHNGNFILYEYKLAGKDLPFGQKLALTRLVDGLSKTSRHAVLFVCEHNEQDPEKDINGASAIVRSVYWKGRWHTCKESKTAKNMTSSFLSYIDRGGT